MGEEKRENRISDAISPEWAMVKGFSLFSLINLSGRCDLCGEK
jgi:hypothetical protein